MHLLRQVIAATVTEVIVVIKADTPKISKPTNRDRIKSVIVVTQQDHSYTNKWLQPTGTIIQGGRCNTTKEQTLY